MDDQDTEQAAPQQATGTADGNETAPTAPEPPLAMVTGLVTVGTEDAPACSDGVCW